MSEAVAPITAKDRVGELDVLRGFALLGVMTVSYTHVTLPTTPYV